jgi:hypothetical protein
MTDKNIFHSYSSTDTYNTCPEQWRSIKWLKKFEGKSNPAAERGSLMHEDLETCLIEDTKYPIAEYRWILDNFRKLSGLKIPEIKLAINHNWEPTDYNLGYTENGMEIPNPEGFYRGAIDLTCINGTHANVWDLKTGKRKMKEPKPYERWLLDRHTEGMIEAPKMLVNARQASEYALMIFHHFPEIKTIEFKFIWSDVEDYTEDVYHFDKERDTVNLHETMLATPTKIQYSMDNDLWEPNPSGLCSKWCEVEDCEYHGKYWSEIKKMQQREKTR